MALEKRNGKLWFREDLYKDTDYSFLVSRVIVPPTKTKFQEIAILETPRYGKVLTLDNIVQLTEEDEAIYHEYMAHWPLFSRSKPKTVFIVGGGDGGIAREVLKHKSVKKVYLVDIDPMVTKLVKKYMPIIPKGAFSDPRLEVIHEDAEKYVRKFKNKIDVLILDSTDPIGPAISLFGADFIQDIWDSLKDGGVMIRQAGSVILQSYEFRGSYKQIEVVFGKDNVRPVLISPATYFGGYFALITAIKGKHDFSEVMAKARSRYEDSKIKTEWYSGKTHKCLAALPPIVKSMLEKERYGEEVIMDLKNFKIPSLAKLKQWSIKTCQAINMIAFGRPMVSSKTVKEGTSFVQYIETSAINFRYLKNIGAANIFTCAELPVQDAMKYTMKFFGAKSGVFWHLPRGSFEEISKVKRETNIFDVQSSQVEKDLAGPKYSPVRLRADKFLSGSTISALADLPAFELVMDIYDCDYTTISSTKAVARWAEETAKISGLKTIGKTDAPDFGHAKKKTSGPSVTQFFEGGSNISHYSSNWLAIFVNIVSQKSYNLKKTIEFTMKYFKAQKAICWIIPRGAQGKAEELAQKTYLAEIKSKDFK